MSVQSFLDRIADHVNLDDAGIVFDVGAGYGEETMELAREFLGVVAFECNPQCLVKLIKDTASYCNVNVVAAMVGKFTGELRPFYPIDTQHTKTTHADGNPRASSMYVATHDYPHETYAQHSIEAYTLALSDYCERRQLYPDVLWMDLQGAELNALKGLGEVLRDVKAIHTEAELKPVYRNQPLFPELNAFLEEEGFVEIHREPWSEYGIDVDYVRRD